jgi:hypothetical protein
VENRIGAIRIPHADQWLSDNGSPYMAHKTTMLAGKLNLILCSTSEASLKSIGVCRAFLRRLNGTMFVSGGWRMRQCFWRKSQCGARLKPETIGALVAHAFAARVIPFQPTCRVIGLGE